MPQYQTFSCMVALSNAEGIIDNVVPKEAVTYPELLILRHIHGRDGVQRVRALPEPEERDEAEERARLAARYTEGRVKAVFPSDHQPLPPGNMTELKNARAEAMRELEEAKASLEAAEVAIAADEDAADADLEALAAIQREGLAADAAKRKPGRPRRADDAEAA